MKNTSSDIRRKYRFAILGCGMIANIHAAAIHRCDLKPLAVLKVQAVFIGGGAAGVDDLRQCGQGKIVIDHTPLLSQLPFRYLMVSSRDFMDA